VILGLAVEIFCRNDLLDDFFHNVFAKLLEGDLLAVLDRDDDGVNTDWNAGSVVESVLACDLLQNMLKC
jgi:hypothetical protein